MSLVLAGGTVDGNTLFDSEALLPATRARVASSPARSPEERSGFYVYGFNVGVEPGGRTLLSHAGAFVGGGGVTAATMIPSMRLGIVVLTNAAPVGVAEATTSSSWSRRRLCAAAHALGRRHLLLHPDGRERAGWIAVLGHLRHGL